MSPYFPDLRICVMFLEVLMGLVSAGFVVMPPFVIVLIIMECVVLDRTLTKRLLCTFEFLYICGLSLFLFWPIAIDFFVVSVSMPFLLAGILGMIASPLPFIWVVLHDASLNRTRLPTIAVTLCVIFLLSGLYFGPILSIDFVVDIYPAWSSDLHLSIFSSNVFEVFTMPAVFQMLVWMCKYLYLLVFAQDEKLLLTMPLRQRVLSEEDLIEHGEPPNEADSRSFLSRIFHQCRE